MSEKYKREITDLLPHRKPFLFVDAVEKADEKIITGTYYFSPELEVFNGHFPEYPVVPGVLLVEMMAQCGGAGLKRSGVIDSDALFFLASIEKAKFRKQVRPGDRVFIEVENVRISPKMIRQKGAVSVDDQIAAEASWMCLVGAQG
jgi:3-hydroxyacyl-[acyl-carrier-protein] dehydratase